MTATVLILGSSRELPRVRAAVAAARAAGLVVPYDWSVGMAEGNDDSNHDDETATVIAWELRIAMDQAQWIWWLIPSVPSQSFGEWMACESNGYDTIASGTEEDRRRSIYRPRRDRFFLTDAAALEYLTRG